jgi:uncharacterized delta-60 repeat protein
MTRAALRTLLLAFAAAGCEPAPPVSDVATVLPLSKNGHDRLVSAAYGADGSLYASGSFGDGTAATTDLQMLVAKLKSDGTLDTSFGKGGYATHNVVVGTNGELARTVIVQSTGKVVVAGAVDHVGAADARDRDIAAVRFDKDGTLDTSFGNGGSAIFDLSDGEVNGESFVADSAWGLLALADDKLVISASRKRAGGTDTDFVLLRLTADGAPDTSFGSDGVFSLDINQRSASARSVLALDGGALLGAGYMKDGDVTKPVLYKVTAAGQLDTSFGTGGYFAEAVLPAAAEIYSVIRQGDKLVTAGYGRADAAKSLDWVSIRVTSDGKLDTSYGANGVVQIDVAGFNDNARNIVALPDNRLMLVGGGRNTEMNADAMVAVLSADGKLDSTFGQGGMKMVDLGGSSDFWWGLCINPAKSHAVAVGVKGVGMDPGNDDAALMMLPLR